ncbi:hypothetical protein DIZ76_014594 [Coccidioides immitis]|nr:hypothetical protein DIZ76_014594 [Coccidioides immitis]
MQFQLLLSLLCASLAASVAINPEAHAAIEERQFPTSIPGFPTSFPQFPTTFPGFPTSFPGFPTTFPGFPSSFPGLPNPNPTNPPSPELGEDNEANLDPKPSPNRF